MAQLRDKQTSTLLSEGTPEEVVLLAEAVGRSEVMFDDVGEKFDPEAVLKVHKEQIDGLSSAAKEEKGGAAKSLRDTAKKIKEREEEAEKKKSEVKKLLDEARSQVKR
jgi:hypothetical protein